MEDAPCGCEQREDAEGARPGERDALLIEAPASALRWQCPRWGYSDEIEGKAAQVAREVERLTGCHHGALRTCPRYEAAGPAVIRALRLYRAQQGAGLTFDDDPPAVLVACADAIGGADAARMDAESEDQKRKHHG